MAAATDPARARNALLTASALAWMVILAGSSGGTVFSHCPAAASGATPFVVSFWTQLAMNSPASLAGGWCLMLVAMMAPTVVAPVLHARLRSLRRRRARATLLVLVAFGAVWMAAGVVLLTIEMAENAIASGPYWPAAAAAAVAIVWQCSPLKQRCLNRCHLHLQVRAFGGAADLDTIRLGLRHGFWCVGSCWALMAAPMLLPRAHVLGMMLAWVPMLAERLEDPAPPSWRWRGLGKLKRIAIARVRVRLNKLGFI